MEPIRVAIILSISFHLFLLGVSSFFVPKKKIYSAPYIVTLDQKEKKKDKKIQLAKPEKEQTRQKNSPSVKNELKKKKEENKKKIPRVTKKANLPKVEKKKVKREKKDPPIVDSHKMIQKAVAQIQQKEKQKSLKSIRQSVEDIQQKLLKQKIAAVQEAQIATQGRPDFYLKTYQDQVWNLIKSQWLIPDSGYDKGKELLTVISIRVLKDGSVQDVKFESESGEPVFDRSALMAIKRVGNFPPFPEEMLKDSIEIGFRFSP